MLGEDARAFLTPPGVKLAGDIGVRARRIGRRPIGASDKGGICDGLFARAKAQVMSRYAGA